MSNNSTLAILGRTASSITTSRIQPITATVASGTLICTLNPTILDFRSTTPSSGALVSRTLTVPLTLTVPSGATLGTVSAVQSRLLLVVIDVAGTLELAIANIAGGALFSETNFISSTAITSGSSLAGSAYSTTARTGYAYRVVGYIESTQATAGTWATTPSTVQGVGGQALTTLSSLGYGQTWQDFTASRAIATTYYNTTGRPIELVVSLLPTTAASTVYANINGVILQGTTQGTLNYATGISFIVPPMSSYLVSGSNSSGLNVYSWCELR